MAFRDSTHTLFRICLSYISTKFQENLSIHAPKTNRQSNEITNGRIKTETALTLGPVLKSVWTFGKSVQRVYGICLKIFVNDYSIIANIAYFPQYAGLCFIWFINEVITFDLKYLVFVYLWMRSRPRTCLLELFLLPVHCCLSVHRYIYTRVSYRCQTDQ